MGRLAGVRLTVRLRAAVRWHLGVIATLLLPMPAMAAPPLPLANPIRLAQAVAPAARPASSNPAPAPARRPDAPARPAANPYVLTADQLTYEEDGELVVATGNVEITRERFRLTADRVTYRERTGQVTADGNVVLIEPEGDTFYGTSTEITGDLRDGFVEAVRVLRTDDSRLAANRAVRENGRTTTLDRAVYSPCPICADSPTPLWQIRATRVVEDREAKRVTYRNAVMEFAGVPVGYTPWFQHSSPDAGRQSGLLPPTFGSSSELGLTYQQPYYWVLGPDRDLTLAPIVSTGDAPVIAGEYREVRGIGRTRIGGSATYTTEYKLDPADAENDELRGNIEGQGRYPLGSLDQAGFDLRLASDNSYLERYGLSTTSRLENRVFGEWVDDRDFLGVDGYYFQGLRERDNQDRIPIALPLVDSRMIGPPMAWGSHWTLDSNLLALTRVEGLDTRRGSVRGGWQLPLQGALGDVWTIETSLRTDLYLTEGNPETGSSVGGSGTEARVLPRFTVDWAYPWISDGLGWGWTLEPVAAFNVAPEDGNPDGIPNEDSQDFEFDDTNLLEPIRYPGLDRNEGGGKVAYGLRFSGVGPRGLELSGLFGQSYRFYGGSPFPDGSGLDDPLSDYVGRVQVRPSSWLDVGFRFRADKDAAELRRSSLNTSIGPSWLKLDIDYVNLSREPSDENDSGFDSREEIVIGARARLTERLSIAARTREDLSRGATVATQAGLIYTHPCLVVTLGAEQSNTSTGEVENETTVLLRLAFKNLGDIEAGGFPGL